MPKISNQLAARLLFNVGIRKIPLIAFARPKLVELTDQQVTLRIKVSRRTKNHINSMYLGALAIGADFSVGFFPALYMLQTRHPIAPVMKSGQVQYLKKVSTYADFTVDQGHELTQMCKTAFETGERLETNVITTVTAPQEFGDQPVARFEQVVMIYRTKRLKT